MMSNRIITEICCGSPEDCVVAEQCGADRIELVNAHFLGGLTPSAGTIIRAKENVKIPIEVIIRPRMSGFAYNQAEFELMCLDAKLALEYGADGIVFGFLTESGELDYEKTSRMLEIIGDKDSVFHRAIDISKDPLQTAEQLISLGVTRILTSGGKTNVADGIPMIKQLHQKHGDKIEIMAGGGVKANNAAKIIAGTGINQIHFGGTGYVADASAKRDSSINFGVSNTPPNDSYIAVSAENLKAIIGNILVEDIKNDN